MFSTDPAAPRMKSRNEIIASLTRAPLANNLDSEDEEWDDDDLASRQAKPMSSDRPLVVR